MKTHTVLVFACGMQAGLLVASALSASWLDVAVIAPQCALIGFLAWRDHKDAEQIGGPKA